MKTEAFNYGEYERLWSDKRTHKVLAIVEKTAKWARVEYRWKCEVCGLTWAARTPREPRRCPMCRDHGAKSFVGTREEQMSKRVLGIKSIKKHGFVVGKTYKVADVNKFLMAASYPLAVPVSDGGCKSEAVSLAAQDNGKSSRRSTAPTVLGSDVAACLGNHKEVNRE